MGIKTKGSIRSRRLRELVELFEAVKSFDEFGEITEELQSLGQYSADVEEVVGSRLAYYQSLGFSHPLNITIRQPEKDFDAVAYNGRMLKISSNTPDAENREYLKIVADYTDDEA